MQRGCMKNAALVLDQKTFSFQRKLNFNFTQKNFFYQNCVCEMVEPKFETEFWPMYWVSSGGWWLYSLVYPHRFSRSQEFFYNWLQVLNMLGFINKNKILAFFPAMAATQTLLYMIIGWIVNLVIKCKSILPSDEIGGEEKQVFSRYVWIYALEVKSKLICP